MFTPFKCGRMNWDGKVLTPDATKGELCITSTSAGHAIQWRNREDAHKICATWTVPTNGAVLSQIPGEQAIKGRLYQLQFSDNQTKQIFWMQEPNPNVDSTNVTLFNNKINEILPSDEPISSLQESLTRGRVTPTQLVSILTTNRLRSLLSDTEAMSDLRQHMPIGQQTDEDVQDVINSTQLHSSMNSLTQAIYSDELPVLLNLIGIPLSSVTVSADPMEILCTALNKDKPNDNNN
eukprot:GHVR01048558.1.p1 GENE.GHVR01048558.1~~GHVR01048558.1.p1  ORF type:complete len:236 (+),score=51.11 GHVR01048558.1:1713-2420(+)